MKKGEYRIAVMSIGSGVGQSVITACNLSALPIKTIGLGMNPMAFGAFECHEMDYVPMIYSEEYIPELIKKCILHDIDLVIPGSDDEALILAENQAMLEEKGIKILVSKLNLLRCVRDKREMCCRLSTTADIFVRSYEPEQAEAALASGEIRFPLIAKPRGGFASRGIHILLEEKDFKRIDTHYIIQEPAIPHKLDPSREAYLDQLYKGINSQVSEISIQLVADKKGELIGRMASCNKLNNGVPIEILPYEDEEIWKELDKIIPILKGIGHRGPLNLQGRMTDQGLKLFEMNARFTGITGLRARMGFNEVEACIRDWLDIDGEVNPLELNEDRAGIRQTTDKVVSLSHYQELEKKSIELNHRSLKARKTWLITGASGYLGQALVRVLAASGYDVVAFSREKERILNLFKECEAVTCIDEREFESGAFNLGLVDGIIHSGFARPHLSNSHILSSLKFTNRLFNQAALYQVPEIINISSQSIYGTKQPGPWTEKASPATESFYAQAKYSGELMAESIKTFSRHSRVTSLRLASLAGGSPGLIPVDVLSRFVEHGIKGETIEIVDGTQRLERLDIRDATSGMLALIRSDSKDWKPEYNFGTGNSHTVKEMGEAAVRVGRELLGEELQLIVKPGDIKLAIEMDSGEFYRLTKWKPRYSLEDTLTTLYKYMVDCKD